MHHRFVQFAARLPSSACGAAIDTLRGAADTHPNSDADTNHHVDRNVDGHRTHPHSNADTNHHVDRDVDGYRHTVRDLPRHPVSEPHAHGIRTADRHSNCDGNADGHPDADADTAVCWRLRRWWSGEHR
jgi:hypothetical protein